MGNVSDLRKIASDRRHQFLRYVRTEGIDGYLGTVGSEEQNNAKEDIGGAWHRTRNQYGNRAVRNPIHMYGNRTPDDGK